MSEVLVLGSCSFYGYRLAGAISALDDRNMLNDIKYLVGSGTGFLLCTLLNLGYKGDRLLSAIKQIAVSLKPGLGCMLSNGSMIDERKLREILSTHLLLDGKVPTLNELKTSTQLRLVACVADLTEQTVKYISYQNEPNINLVDLVIMALNVPCLFKPNNRGWVNAGTINPYPTNVIKSQGIGIYSSIEVEPQGDTIHNLLNYYQLPIKQLVERNIRKGKNYNHFKIQAKGIFDTESEYLSVYHDVSKQIGNKEQVSDSV